MTDFSRSPEALLRPELARRYFDCAPPPSAGAPCARFDVGLAWWLAELTRLSYVREAGEYDGPAGLVGRAAVAQGVCLKELAVLERAAGHVCALVLEGGGPALPAGRYLVFRGTDSVFDWMDNMRALQVDCRDGGRAHAGFLAVLDSIWPALRPWLARPAPAVVFAGHSQGGALAALATLRAAAEGLAPGACYTFGAPAIGNRQLAARAAGLPLFRVANHLDLVTMLPVSFGPLQWLHLGQAWYLDGAARLHGPLADQQLEELRRAGSPPFRWDAMRGALLALARDRGIEIPALLSDHAPVNYVAALERAAHAAAAPAAQ